MISLYDVIIKKKINKIGQVKLNILSLFKIRRKTGKLLFAVITNNIAMLS